MAGDVREVELLYGREGLRLRVPAAAEVLAGADPPPLTDPAGAVRAALAAPLGAPPLAELVRVRRPATVAITVSDLTRPVPYRELLPPLLEVLAAAGVEDRQLLVVIGTGMHRPTTTAERELILGAEVLSRLEVIDHRADEADSLVEVSRDPPVRVSRRFLEADLRIVTGLIEPHFMAGYSGGPKGVCPALVDLRTIEVFHGYRTLADPRADSGVLDGNPCQDISLEVARRVGVDLLLNAAITRSRRLAGVYCGELVAAHRAGCAEVAGWVTAPVREPFDLVVTSGGGFPLDQTFYQSVKGMVGALPALGPGSELLLVTGCGEGLGSAAYEQILLRWGEDWRGFLAHLAARPQVTDLDQWELQMQCRVLERIGPERLWLASDGIPLEVQRRLALRAAPGSGAASARAQALVDAILARRPGARVAVVPDGPYTMLVPER